MVDVGTILADWRKEGLRWKNIFAPIIRPITFTQERKIFDSETHVPTLTEGFLYVFSAVFDHPLCGIRIESYPEMDSQDSFTIQNLLIGMSRYDPWLYVKAPPDNPPGIYSIRRQKDWWFPKWLRLYLINTDRGVAHTCLGYGYMLAVAFPKEQKPQGV